MNKKESLNIRFTAEQLRNIRRAARLETARRGENIEAGSLVRELVMPRIEEILAAVAVPA